MNHKKPWQSKTLWLAAIAAVAPLIPGVSDFVANNPTTVTMALGVLFGILRTITKGAVSIS